MAGKSLEFRLKKAPATSDTEKRTQKKGPSRVYVNQEALIELTGSRNGGRAIIIERVSGPPGEGREATLWEVASNGKEKLDKTSAQLYEPFREACGFKGGESVKITVLPGGIPEATEVVIEEDLKQEKDKVVAFHPLSLTPEDIPPWEWYLDGRLSQIDHVHAGLQFKNIFTNGPERSFVVKSVNGRTNGNARFVHKKTKVKISAGSEEDDGAANQASLEVTGIRGLDSEIKKLNDQLGYFTSNLPFRVKPSYRGIVIHGGHGTGKTLLLDTIANTGWGTVYRIQFKDKLSEIQEVFQAARLQQPSIILMDQFERLIDKERNNRGAVIQTICEALDSLAADAKLKGEIPQVAVIAACSDYITDMPEDLREPGRFTSDIYLPLPDVEGRKQILASFNLHVDPKTQQDLLHHLAEKTHAYNGKDLRRLVDTAQDLGRIRQDVVHNPQTNGDPTPEPPPPSTTLYYTPQDYTSALLVVRPSAMHDINLKPPPIRWSDIGGQDSVKKSLRRAVRLSTEKPEILARFFDRPPKGFLLYGPPGCSKTMAAQAMATESGLNFFAVKGAELLNMYVGESERAVRRLFQRAREVAPSMIFFDEIDAIAGQRHGFGGKGDGGGATSSGGSSHGGLNVLTTLLNEMDGFEALSGVVVLAATNRPQALDPALLRPGRFDDLIYVSPPDWEARKAIFEGVARKRRMARDVQVEALAGLTEGYSGAEIKGICAAAGTAAYDRYMEGWGEGDGDGVEGGEKGGVKEEKRVEVKEEKRVEVKEEKRVEIKEEKKVEVKEEKGDEVKEVEGVDVKEGGEEEEGNEADWEDEEEEEKEKEADIEMENLQDAIQNMDVKDGGKAEKEGRDPAINMADLEHAIRNMKRQITREMIQGFENWEKQFKKI